MSRFIIAIIGLFFLGVAEAQNTYNIIPQPKQLTPQKGVFTLRKGANVSIGNEVFAPEPICWSARPIGWQTWD